jgi:hypothetical protein
MNTGNIFLVKVLTAINTFLVYSLAAIFIASLKRQYRLD